MDKTSLFNVGYSKVGKRIQWMGSVLLVGFSLFAVWAWFDGQLGLEAKLWVTIGIPMFLYIVVDESRFQLIVTETGITRRGIRTKTIDFSEISRVVVYHNHIRIKSSWASIAIYQVTDQRKQITAEILRRVKQFPQIKLIGKQKDIDSYLNNKSL